LENREKLIFSEISRNYHRVVFNYAFNRTKEVVFDPWTIQKSFNVDRIIDFKKMEPSEISKTIIKKLHLIHELKVSKSNIKSILNCKIGKLETEYINFTVFEVEKSLPFKKVVKQTLLSKIKKIHLEVESLQDALYVISKLDEIVEISIHFKMCFGMHRDKEKKRRKDLDIPTMKHLKKITLHFIDVGSSDLWNLIAICDHIEELNILHNYCNGMEIDFPPSFLSLKNLKRFCLSGDGTSEPCCIRLADSDLAEFINSLEEITCQSESLDGSVFKLIQNKNLQKLHIERSPHDGFIHKEKKFHRIEHDLLNLKEMVLKGFDKVLKQEFLESLKIHCPNLQRLEIESNEEGKDHLLVEMFQENQFPNLKLLILSGNLVKKLK
jgi:hypothetical protein